MSEQACDICNSDSHSSVLVHTHLDGGDKLYCMRCFHGLLHGMSPDALRQRWEVFKASQGQ